MIATRYADLDMARKTKTPKMGPHLKSALWVQEIVKYHDVSQEKFAEMADLSRGGLTKLLYGWQRPRWDSLEKLKAVAPPFLKDYDDWQSADHHALVGGSVKSGTYTVHTKEAAAVGDELDSILDLSLRRRARNAALTAIEQVVSAPEPPKKLE